MTFLIRKTNDVHHRHSFPRAMTNATNRWLRTMEIGSLRALEAGRLKSRCQQGPLPLEGSREESLCLVASGRCPQSLVSLALSLLHSDFCLHHTQPILPVCFWVSSYKDPSHWVRAHPNLV